MRVKSFWNTATYLHLRGGVPSTPPPPLYQGEGMNLRVCPKVNILLFICLWQWKKAFIHYAINPSGSWPSFMGTSPHWGVPPGFGGLHHHEAMVLLSWPKPQIFCSILNEMPSLTRIYSLALNIGIAWDCSLKIYDVSTSCNFAGKLSLV